MRYKRPYDIFLITVFIPVWIPICVIIGLLVLLTSGFPIFYTQERLGIQRARLPHHKIPHHDPGCRMGDGTRLGQRWKIPVSPLWGECSDILGMDELPQIINVIKGEMSLVGPRPERPELAESGSRERFRIFAIA